MNFGELFKRDFESDDSIIQRILMSNNGVSLHMLKNILKTQKEVLSDGLVTYGNINGKLNQQILNAYEIYKKNSEINETERIITYKLNINPWQYHKRNCPKCARQHFHSYLFDLPWLGFCPIHRKPLISCCPQCGNLWRKGVDAKESECSYCTIDMKFVERTKEQLNFCCKERDTLETLNIVIDEGFKSKRLYSGVTNDISIRDSQDVCHSNYPSTLSSENLESKLFFEKFKVPLTEMNIYSYSLKIENALEHKKIDLDLSDMIIYPRFYKNNLNLPCNVSGKLELPTHLYRVRLKALKIIFNEVKKHYGENYFRAINGLPLNLSSIGDCPYRLALSYWYYYVLSNWKNQRWFFNEYKNSIYGTNLASLFPDPVAPVTFLINNNMIYSLPKEAQSQIYLNDLLELFKIFFHYFKRYMQSIDDFDGKSVHYDTIKYRCHIDSATGSNLATVLENDKLKVYIPARDEPSKFALESYHPKNRYKYLHEPKEKLIFGFEKESFLKLRKVEAFYF